MTERLEGVAAGLRWVAVPVAGMWLLEGLDALLGGRLDGWGIVPRTLRGLRGVPLAPWLHASFGHLAANTPWLLLFGLLVRLRGRGAYLKAWAGSTLLGGIGVWLLGDPFGPASVHLGASIVVFGFLGFLLALGCFERRLGSMLLSALVALGYAGMLRGLLPGRPGVSWEGHLFGFLGGVAAAHLEARRRAAGSSAR